VVESALQKQPHKRLASAEIMLARIKNVEMLLAAQKAALAAAGEARGQDKHVMQEKLPAQPAQQQQHQKQQQQQQQQQDTEAEKLKEEVGELMRANRDFHHTIKTQQKEAVQASKRMHDLALANQARALLLR